MLYKRKEEQTIEVAIRTLNDKTILFDFHCDCGKFGTYESLAGFKLTPERLLQILQEREDITDEEYE
jgi:hypothetical protein